jgi:hypothetical protein
MDQEAFTPRWELPGSHSRRFHLADAKELDCNVHDDIAYRPHAQLVRRAGEDAEGNYDAAKREYEIVLKLQSGNTPAKGSLRKLGLKISECR